MSLSAKDVIRIKNIVEEMMVWSGKNSCALGVDTLCISWISLVSDPGFRYSRTSHINTMSKVSSLKGRLKAEDTMNSEHLQYFFAIFNALM